jgi:hypothetical protein
MSRQTFLAVIIFLLAILFIWIVPFVSMGYGDAQTWQDQVVSGAVLAAPFNHFLCVGYSRSRWFRTADDVFPTASSLRRLTTELRLEAEGSFAHFRLPFIQRGTFTPTARTHCPLITGLLREQVGEISSAMYRYSRNGPGKHRRLADHLLYHLALGECKGTAFVTVDGAVCAWETGYDLLMDSKYVRHETTPGDPVLILEIEFRRPPNHLVAAWLQYILMQSSVTVPRTFSSWL